MRFARYALRDMHNAVHSCGWRATCLLSSLLLVGGCVDANTRPAIPPEYSDRRPPPGIQTNPDAVARGRRIYEEHCSVCHGDEGNGTGPYAVRLAPQPADFTNVSAAARRTPAYLFWRISEGKNAEPFYSQGSAMPAWKHHLTEAEIWQVIAYLYTFSDLPPD